MPPDQYWKEEEPTVSKIRKLHLSNDWLRNELAISPAEEIIGAEMTKLEDFPVVFSIKERRRREFKVGDLVRRESLKDVGGPSCGSVGVIRAYLKGEKTALAQVGVEWAGFRGGFDLGGREDMTNESAGWWVPEDALELA